VLQMLTQAAGTVSRSVFQQGAADSALNKWHFLGINGYYNK